MDHHFVFFENIGRILRILDFIPENDRDSFFSRHDVSGLYDNVSERANLRRMGTYASKDTVFAPHRKVINRKQKAALPHKSALDSVMKELMKR
jgi:hypothetical protein